MCIRDRSKPVKQGFKVNSLDTYGTLLINVTHAFDNHPLLVQLLNAQDQVVKEVKAVNGVAEFYTRTGSGDGNHGDAVL